MLIFGCHQDEPEGTRANILTDTDQVYFQGDPLIFEAIFTNDLGLKQIEIVNEKLDIAFEENLEGEIVYHLKYTCSAPSRAIFRYCQNNQKGPVVAKL